MVLKGQTSIVKQGIWTTITDYGIFYGVLLGIPIYGIVAASVVCLITTRKYSPSEMEAAR